MTTGPATLELLEELHSSILRALVGRLRGGKASAEWLYVARSYLKSNGMFGRPLSRDDQQRLQDLWDLLLVRLMEALQGPAPSTAVIAEVRKVLADNGTTKDLVAAIGDANALTALHDLDLPFKTH